MKSSAVVLMIPEYSHRIFSCKGRSHSFLYSCLLGKDAKKKKNSL